jgi:hypothetical protein
MQRTSADPVGSEKRLGGWPLPPLFRKGAEKFSQIAKKFYS